MRRAVFGLSIVAGVVAGVAVASFAGDALMDALISTNSTLDRVDPARLAPLFPFRTRDGEAHNLADFRGKPVLVNLWATWCVPCVYEMPSLDRAQQKLGDRLRILAIAEDETGEGAVGPFLAKRSAMRLAVFLDLPHEAARAFDVHALPTSFLIDRSGRIVASLSGAAIWDSPQMMAELERYLAEDERRNGTAAPTRPHAQRHPSHRAEGGH